MSNNEQDKNEIKSRYTNVAKFYENRPGYDHIFFKRILTKFVPNLSLDQLMVADIGSGNGLSRKALVAAGCNPEKVYEIEPNGSMRALSAKNGGLRIFEGT